MRIGIDFDNTIACYDGVFHAVALERGLIPADLAADKNSVRDYLNGSGRKDVFTELQGYVYGARMNVVKLYPGVKQFLRAARAAGHHIVLVSHKTRYPILGPAYDMHAAARGFLEMQGLIGGEHGFASDDVFFEQSKDEKVARAAALGCDTFIDDLPEILHAMRAAPGLGSHLKAVLFDPSGDHRNQDQFARMETWADIVRFLLGSTARVPA